MIWLWTKYALAGKILIFLFQKVFNDNYSPTNENFLVKLFKCDLCLGFWVYSLLAFVFKIDIFESEYIIISEVLTGAVTTFVVWVFSEGWSAKFREIVLE